MQRRWRSSCCLLQGGITLKRLPGFWGEWYFIGQMPAPHNQMTENGPTTDVAMLVPNITKVSDAIGE